MVWCDELAADAQSWANNIASRGVFEHAKERKGAGENIAMCSGKFKMISLQIV